MSKKKGKWIPLDITPSELFSQGVPKKGDSVILSYDKKGMPHTGRARLIESFADTNKEMAKSPEYGEDYIYTGMIF